MCYSTTRKVRRKYIYTVRRPERNGKCKNQVNLLMIGDGEKRHYTAIKNISRLLSKLNGKLCTRITIAWTASMVFVQGQQEISTMSTAAALWRCRWSNKNVPRQGLCGKVRRIHRWRGKVAVCNISTAAHDRTYRKENTRQQKSVTSASKISMTHRIKK